MPPPEEAYREQSAVLWRATGTYDRYGQPKLSAAEDVDVRWIQRRTEVQDAQGNTVTLDATVISVEDIPVGSEMWLGRLEDFLGTGSGGPETEIHVVRTGSDSPDVKGRIFRKRYGLTKKSDALGEIG